MNYVYICIYIYVYIHIYIYIYMYTWVADRRPPVGCASAAGARLRGSHPLGLTAPRRLVNELTNRSTSTYTNE